jgi:5-methylcytosine-specific restriction protein B
MYLLEYRDREVPLAGGGKLKVPSNVRLIGTMNTADRSIALVDHALRRRFAFIPLYPNYEVLTKYHSKNQNGFSVDGLIGILNQLNKRIDDPNYHLGISFFLRQNIAHHIEDIWRMEIEPYLEEYFFDQLNELAKFRWDEVKEKILP